MSRMKRYLLLIFIFITIVNSLFFTSCKKITHDPHPSPGGLRLASYSLKIDTNFSYPAGVYIHNTENDNYAFSYDSLNRLIQIFFTSNNPQKLNQHIAFTYSNDSIFKSITSLNTAVLIENDTFVLNDHGQLSITFTPNISTSFQYYENLLTTVITTNETSRTAVTSTFTSDAGNFLENNSGLGNTFNQNFAYNTGFPDMIGDYLQINSFTMYGYNIYKVVNLIHTIKETGHTTTVSYGIDAYSNITAATATTIDSIGNTSIGTYSFQYESY